MTSKIISSSEQSYKEPIRVLKNGGIVIFPTDTAFAIGCRIDDAEAVDRLFRLRNRPETKATPVLVSSLEMAKRYWTELPDLVVEKLIEPYWPGALTIVLPCDEEKVPSLVRGGGSTLGLRMPNNKIALGLIEGVGVPILGTSANFAGGQTPFAYYELNSKLVSMADCVVPGSCSIKKASTVIDCSNKTWKILRHGAIKLELSG